MVIWHYIDFVGVVMFSLCLSDLVSKKQVHYPEVPSGAKKGDLFVGYEETVVKKSFSRGVSVTKEPRVFEVDIISSGDLSMLAAFTRHDLAVTEEDISELERMYC